MRDVNFGEKKRWEKREFFCWEREKNSGLEGNIRKWEILKNFLFLIHYKTIFQKVKTKLIIKPHNFSKIKN